MHSDDAVRQALKALADADAARRAPTHVERALLDAFDRQRVRSSSPRSAWHAVVATCVVALLTVAVYRKIFDPVDVSPPPTEPDTSSVRSERRPPALEDQVDAPTATEIARPLVMTRAQPTAASSVRDSVPPHVVSTHRESEMIGQTVQLRLPRSALLLLGIPIIEPEIEGTVNVELLLTEDGQAKTIRVVQ